MESLIFIALFCILIVLLPIFIKYQKSSYKNASGHTFTQTIFYKGNYGEFLTYYILEKIKGKNKLLTNLYLPRHDGSTTEVDLSWLQKQASMSLNPKIIVDDIW